MYTSGPLTKAGMLERIAEGRPVDPKLMSKFKIKRAGRDADDIFWKLGKLHGLENLAYVSEEDLAATGGNPMKVQMLLDKINDSEKPLPPHTFDKLIEGLH
jgi:hypothetical protein